ncbi:MAG: LacI family DNA-binding transcriptional regulator [Anaerolineae bacterium]|nr:LacI family DNA-binding transcriptional regulator [Anaerolineae bacterium]
MATIRDVAQHAGVSIATVSHVINNTRPVSPELRERVQTAMHALGYQRNTVARALRSKQSLAIGVIVPDSTNPFFTEVTRGIEDISEKNEYSVILCDSRGNLAREAMHTQNLLMKQADGIIYVAAGGGESHIQQVIDQGVPVVLVERDPHDLAVDAVLIDNREGARLAVEHLLALGHQRIACITGPQRRTPRSDRLQGFRDYLHAAGFDPPEGFIREGNFSCDSGYEQGLTLLNAPERPTAIFAFNDLTAMGVLRAAAELGLRVPEDLSVVGFDDIYLMAYSVPPLTTIHLPIHEMGQEAMHMLLDRIDNRDAPPSRKTLPIDLITRASTAAAPAARPPAGRPHHRR